MLILGTPAWNIILRTAAIYLALLFGLRLAGKREIGQMTMFDLVVLLLIANAVQNAMVGPDTSLIGGVIAAAMLLVMNYALAQLRLTSPRLRRLVEGSPTVLVSMGILNTGALRREGLDKETLEAALREHGVAKLEDVEMAVLEIDGSISVIPKGGEVRRVRHPKALMKK